MRARSLLPSRLALSLLLFSLGALVLAAGGFAAFSITTPATASFSVALDGTDQTPVYQLPITVAATGQGHAGGWHLLASATQFVNGTYTFPATASSMLSMTLPTSCSGGGCTVPAPSGSVVYPITLPNTGGAAIYSAAAGSGDGTNVVTANIQVATPANVYAGTYTSTVTVQVVAGP
jgi:hypothetical protein